MTKPAEDFDSARAPFEMSFEEMQKFWERYAVTVNAPSDSNHIPRAPQEFLMYVDCFNKEMPDERTLVLGVDRVDHSQGQPVIILLHIREASDGKSYDLLLNLDPFFKIAKNEDPEDGTLRAIKTFPKTWAGARAMFKECEEKILRALKEGDDYAANESQRLKNAQSGQSGPGPDNHSP